MTPVSKPSAQSTTRHSTPVENRLSKLPVSAHCKDMANRMEIALAETGQRDEKILDLTNENIMVREELKQEQVCHYFLLTK